MSSAAKRRKDAASAKKAKTEARKGHITEISKKRSAMEQAKVSYTSDSYAFSFISHRHQIMLDGVDNSDIQLADSMKRFNYLLGQTELFQHFVDLKVSIPDLAILPRLCCRTCIIRMRLMVAAKRARICQDAR